jgi:uncharacterized integral membrane protein
MRQQSRQQIRPREEENTMTGSTDHQTKADRTSGFGAKLALAIAVVLTVGLLIFVLQNTVHTRINFIAWNFDVAQGVSLLGAAAIGAIIALIVSAAVRLRRALC